MKMKPGITDSDGGVLLVVIIIAVIGTFASMATLQFTSANISASKNKRTGSSLMNIAESGKEYAFAKLRSSEIEPGAGTEIEIATDMAFGGGAFTVTCSSNVAVDSLWIVSVATLNKKSKAIEVTALYSRSVLNIDFSTIRGAVTAKGDITTKGNIIIDGQDYNEAGD
ncbi:MAG: hypothetical protein GF401_14725 [Chitinivibrionales bacterium]|nr:hypothetical protein [Chitinivibrionales bacterium]